MMKIHFNTFTLTLNQFLRHQQGTSSSQSSATSCISFQKWLEWGTCQTSAYGDTNGPLLPC